MKLAAMVALMVVLALGPGMGGPGPAVSQEVGPVRSGDRVRVDGRRWGGTEFEVVGLTPDSLLVRDVWGEMGLELATIRRLEVRRARSRGDQLRRDALIGLVAGAAAGAMIAYMPGQYCNLLGDCYPIRSPEQPWWVSGGAALGLGIGAVVGATRTPTSVWQVLAPEEWRPAAGVPGGRTGATGTWPR